MDDYLSWGGVDVRPPAFLILNIHELYQTAHRTPSRRVPGQSGITTYPGLDDAVTVGLELVIFGRENPAGTPFADPTEGVQTNLATLAAVCTPVATGNGTRTVTWNRRGALATLTCDCVVGPLEIGSADDDAITAAIDITLPFTNGTGWT